MPPPLPEEEAPPLEDWDSDDDQEEGGEEGGTVGDGVEVIDPRTSGMTWDTREDAVKCTKDWAAQEGFTAVISSSKGAARSARELEVVCNKCQHSGTSHKKGGSASSGLRDRGTTGTPVGGSCCRWKIQFKLIKDRWRVTTGSAVHHGPHSHELNAAVATHAARMRSLPKGARESIKLWCQRGLKPIQITDSMRTEYPGHTLSLKDIRNITNPMVESCRSQASVMVNMLLQEKKDDNWAVFFECVALDSPPRQGPSPG